jgi:hypothetical protein
MSGKRRGIFDGGIFGIILIVILLFLVFSDDKH